ncbi:hypothetical protein [Corynebacterium sp. 22KM0430]|uniref:hypothetical protein n=1 Tax=Corynebacterium sp. 22KM0430 TaxID=2989735 RepID=UPI0029C9C6CE|nr:hypothetical protein [Corynebacterium sp. 22KM0430]WPF65712.1 hypothetical protein OLX12_09090 [Corynebacterium sp. 22KM0430]
MSQDSNALSDLIEERVKGTGEWVSFHGVMIFLGCHSNSPTLGELEGAVRQVLSTGRLRLQTMKPTFPYDWYPLDTPPEEIARDILEANDGNVVLNMFSCVVDTIPGVSA